MASVTLKDLYKVYDSGRKQVVAVDHVNLKVENGEFLAFLGPSGCGKTSTLRMIAGLEQITGGEIWLGDRLVNDLNPSERDVAMAFETYALYTHLTVRENISFCLRAKGVGGSEVDERVEGIAQALNLTDLLPRKPSELSGGQQQMVSLARALVRKPTVFLLDEPLSHLDTGTRSGMREMIKLLHYRLETTMIYVTHDQTEALALADRIAVMKDGRIEQVGTREQLFNQPATMFVAQFVGEPSINMIQCKPGPNRQLIQCGSNGRAMQFTVSDEVHRTLEARQQERYHVGIRPHDLHVTPEGLERCESITGQVIVFEFVGERCHLLIERDGVQMMALAPADTRLEAGETATLYYDPRRIHVFDPQTAKRLG